MKIFLGANLVPENLETGEYKIDGTAEIDELEPAYIVAYAEDTYGWTLNGIYSGIQYFAFKNGELLRAWLINIKLASKDNYILNIFTVPKLALSGFDLDSHTEIDNDITSPAKEVTLVSTPSQIDGYTVVNQKLRTYPYMYVRL